MSEDGTLGRRFAEAIAAKDFDRIGELVDPEVDFRGLTPRRAWEASTAEELVEDVLKRWLGPSEEVEGLVDVETGRFADRERVSYSFRGHNDRGPFVVEQQAYFSQRQGRIDWIRVLCSGFRPPAEPR